MNDPPVVSCRGSPHTSVPVIRSARKVLPVLGHLRRLNRVGRTTFSQTRREKPTRWFDVRIRPNNAPKAHPSSLTPHSRP